MQKQVESNLYRLDYKENEVWNNVLTGTDGVDFSVTDDEIYVLRKVSNQFIIENYDLSASLNWSSTSTLPAMTAQFINAEMFHGSGDTLFIHFVDPGTANGGSVYQFDGTNWTDLNAGNFKRVHLDNANHPVGLSVATTSNPNAVVYTLKKQNPVTTVWDVIGTVSDPHMYQDCDFLVAENDSIYLASIYYDGSSFANLFAFHNGNVVQKDSMLFLVMEFITSTRFIEDKKGDLLLQYSNTELGPWSWVTCRKWRIQQQNWDPSPSLGIVSNEFFGYLPQYAKITDVAVDECNTYFTAFSYQQDWAWINDSIHTHVRKYVNCNYLDHINKPDTVAGQLVAHAGPFYNYQWIDCETNLPIPGATDSVLTIPGNGMYAVVISNEDCSDTSNCIDLSTLGVGSQKPATSIKVWPNPGSDFVFITNDEEGGQVLITDQLGSVKMKKDFMAKTEMLSISSWPAGIYFIRIGEEISYFVKY